MFAHWYVREGMAEERIQRLADDRRPGLPSRGRRVLGRLLIAAGERLDGSPAPAGERRLGLA